jgi:hypothetical protein
MPKNLSPRGEHLWVISGNVVPLEVAWYASQNASITKLVRGMGLVRSFLDGFESSIMTDDPFLESWKTQDAASVDRLNDLHLIKRPKAKGYFQAEPTYFQTSFPAHGASFMYDAIMMQALGRCQQQLAEDKGNTVGADSWNRKRGTRRRLKGEASTIRRRMKKQIETNPHLEGIFSTEINGATGRVAFCESFIHTGNRSSTRNNYVWCLQLSRFRCFRVVVGFKFHVSLGSTSTCESTMDAISSLTLSLEPFLTLQIS